MKPTNQDKEQPKMRVTNIYRLNEVLHRLIIKKKKHKGNKNVQQIWQNIYIYNFEINYFFLEDKKHF